MKSKKLEMYVAPELVNVECELNEMILVGSLKPGESEGGEEGDDL